MNYKGPDKDFGEHDDYLVGDVVHTYDNEDGTVLGVIGAGTLSGIDTVYEVSTSHGPRYFDGTRLALVKRNNNHSNNNQGD